MPTSFDTFTDGDVIQAHNVAEMHAPIQNLERGAAFYAAGISGGSSSAYTATLSPGPDSPYPAGMLVNLNIDADNVAGSPNVTLDVNGVGAKPILKNGAESLVAGDLKAGQIVSLAYDDAGDGAFKLITIGNAFLRATDTKAVSMRAGSVAYANSDDVVVLDLTGRRGWLHFADSNDSKCRAFVTASAVSIEAGSADWVASSTPASGEVGMYVSSSALHLVLGSAAARSIGFIDQLVEF